jgi:hypothetical protein
MRIFQLMRDEDVSGVSGTGVVAEGIEFWDGVCAIRWYGVDASTVVWPSIAAAERVHGHDGRTRFEFIAHELDDQPRDFEVTPS